jgi:DNA (cytosine-5)-methyltransferase 1
MQVAIIPNNSEAMKYLSICSGIEAASVAWHSLGWQPVGFSEIEPFPSAVLAHHWPDVPNLGDMTKHNEWTNIIRPDLIVGGTPCQAFSVAGLRQGLADPRGNLTLVFLSILEQYRPTWVVWENVPGVLSDKTGAFGAFLGGLGQLGYGFAYRVLDAQYFGVAQRRRRVFVVAHLGDWRRAAAVLFERESMCGNPPPSREKREGITCDASSSIASGKPTVGTLMAAHSTKLWPGNQEALSGDYHILTNAYALAGNTIERQPHNGGNGSGYSEEVCYTLTKMDKHAVAFGFEPGITEREGNPSRFTKERSPTLRANMGDNQAAVAQAYQSVRRLTPTECERLQGFPDGHTLIPWRNKPAVDCPDGPRYKALGNSMAVPVMRWIGERIEKINNIKP